MGDALATLEQQYFFLRDNQFDLLAACKTDDQKNTILSNLVAARRNYWNCINKIFHDDDPRIVDGRRTDEGGTVVAGGHGRAADNVTKVLTAVTKAVSMGTQLAAMAA